MPKAQPLPQPEHLVEPENPLPPCRINDLPPWLRENARAMGWQELNPVQRYCLPYMLEGRDMMIQARTGSGKTGGFLLPILELIDPQVRGVQALILVPTRELAQQVLHEAEKLSAGTGIRPVAVYGGVAYGPQVEAFKAGAQIVVGTPGRILDHLMRRTMSLANLETLVFDEADRMLSMGFYPDMLAVKRYLPGSQCGFMFSATYPQTVRSLASQFLRKPGFLSLSLDQVHVSDTQHVYYETPAMEKDRCLIRILEAENPESAIIFCNTKVKVNYVATVLARYGYDSDQISADLTQKDRERVLEKLRRKNLRFLVATDVAGRGIDIPRMSHVIIYDFPDDQESYIHRAGRTGRAGASGTAITLANEIEKSELQRLGKRFGIEFEHRPLPTDADLTNLLLDRLTLELEAHLRTRDNLQVERIERMMPVVNALCERDGEPLVLAMLLYDFHQGLLKKVPEVPALPPPAQEPEPAGKAAHEKPGKGRKGGREELKADAKPVEPKTRSEESPRASGAKADGPVPGGRAGRRNEPKSAPVEVLKPAPEPATAAAPVVAKAAKPASPASTPASARPLASGSMARRPVKSLAARRQEAVVAQVAAPVSVAAPAAPENPKAPEPMPTATAKATPKARAKTDSAKAQPVKVEPAKVEPVKAAPVAKAPAPVKAGDKTATATKPKKPATAKVEEPKAPEPPAAKAAKQEKAAGGKSAKALAPARVAGKASASTGKLAEKPAGVSAAAKAPVKTAKKPVVPVAAALKAVPAKVKKKAG